MGATLVPQPIIAVGLAGESPAVGIDCLPTWLYSTLARGDPASERSNGNVLESSASLFAGRNMSARPHKLGVNSAVSKRPMWPPNL